MIRTVPAYRTSVAILKRTVPKYRFLCTVPFNKNQSDPRSRRRIRSRRLSAKFFTMNTALLCVYKIEAITHIELPATLQRY